MGSNFFYVNKPWHIRPVFSQHPATPGIKFNLPAHLHPSPL